jgi:hypothetical protein
MDIISAATIQAKRTPNNTINTLVLASVFVFGGT